MIRKWRREAYWWRAIALAVEGWRQSVVFVVGVGLGMLAMWVGER